MADLSPLKRRFHVIKSLLGAPLGPDAQPLEIRAAVLDAIEERAEPIGRGHRALPGNRLHVRTLARTAAERSSLELIFADLDAKIRERLEEIRCDVPEAFEVSVSFLKKAPSDWTQGQIFALECQTRMTAEAVVAAPSTKPGVRIQVLKGTATKRLYSFTEATILIGRTADVKESGGHVLRNHVAFDNENATVSRAHARLKF